MTGLYQVPYFVTVQTNYPEEPVNVSNFIVSELAERERNLLAVLLNKENLPVSDLSDADWLSLAGVVEKGELIAGGGVEKCGQELLLRSLVVSPSCRNQGLGKLVVENLHAKAHTSGYGKIYLLTLDAMQYFSESFSYVLLDRQNVPADIAASSQFSHTCPGSASLMVCSL